MPKSEGLSLRYRKEGKRFLKEDEIKLVPSFERKRSDNSLPPSPSPLRLIYK